MGLRTFTLVLLTLGFMLLDHKWVFFSKIRFVLNAAVTPIQYIVDLPVEFFGAIANNLTTSQNLVEDNASLKVQALLLRAQIQRLQATEKENNQLRALLGSTPKAGGRVLVAQVLAVDSDPSVQQIVLNRGAEKSISVGQPVLDAQGVMGQVIQVGPWTSRAMLLSDTRSGIPVSVLRNGLRAIAIGDGSSGLLQLINIPVTADLKLGDVLVSSGLGLRYPSGYPVGLVSQVIHKKGAPYLSVIVTPSAHLNRSRLVLLVWPQESNIATDAKKQLSLMQQQGAELRKQSQEVQNET